MVILVEDGEGHGKRLEKCCAFYFIGARTPWEKIKNSLYSVHTGNGWQMKAKVFCSYSVFTQYDHVRPTTMGNDENGRVSGQARVSIVHTEWLLCQWWGSVKSKCKNQWQKIDLLEDGIWKKNRNSSGNNKPGLAIYKYTIKISRVH